MSLLLEARVYELLSELLLFGVVLKPKLHGAFIWDCSAWETILCQMNLGLNTLHFEGLQQVSLHPEINFLFRCLLRFP